MPENLKLVASGRNRGFVWFVYCEMNKWLVEAVAGNTAKSFTTSTEQEAMALIGELRADYEAGNF
jgi:hypothetical protein